MCRGSRVGEGLVAALAEESGEGISGIGDRVGPSGIEPQSRRAEHFPHWVMSPALEQSEGVRSTSNFSLDTPPHQSLKPSFSKPFPPPQCPLRPSAFKTSETPSLPLDNPDDVRLQYPPRPSGENRNSGAGR